jgi:hypothetical protein
MFPFRDMFRDMIQGAFLGLLRGGLRHLGDGRACGSVPPGRRKEPVPRNGPGGVTDVDLVPLGIQEVGEPSPHLSRPTDHERTATGSPASRGHPGVLLLLQGSPDQEAKHLVHQVGVQPALGSLPAHGLQDLLFPAEVPKRSTPVQFPGPDLGHQGLPPGDGVHDAAIHLRKALAEFLDGHALLLLCSGPVPGARVKLTPATFPDNPRHAAGPWAVPGNAAGPYVHAHGRDMHAHGRGRSPVAPASTAPQFSCEWPGTGAEPVGPAIL